MPNVKGAYESRARISRLDSFPQIMGEEIRQKKARRVRIHDSGDFYSFDYFHKWMMVAEANPAVSFYAYTKMVSLAKSYDESWRIPKNVTLIFSFGGKEDALIDVEKDRHSRVFSSLAELKAAGYVDASKDDAKALGKNQKIGLVYHGAKNRSFHS